MREDIVKKSIGFKFSLIWIVLLLALVSLAFYLIATLPFFKDVTLHKADFVSLEYKWGVKDTLENHYSTADSIYQYVNNRDSVLVKKIGLKSDDILYIHSKANELGLWNFPDTIGKKSPKSMAVPRYDLFFKYKQKNKHVVIYGDYDGNPKLLDAAMQMKNIIEERITQAEKRSGK